MRLLDVVKKMATELPMRTIGKTRRVCGRSLTLLFRMEMTIS